MLVAAKEKNKTEEKKYYGGDWLVILDGGTGVNPLRRLLLNKDLKGGEGVIKDFPSRETASAKALR